MPFIVVRHKAKDFDKWKPVYKEHGATRKKAGCKGGRVFRNANDPSETIVLFEWDNLKNARAFAESADLRQTMERAGVIDKPDVYFLEEIKELEEVKEREKQPA